MTKLLDGVIFAKKRKTEGWIEHKRKDGQAAEKKQLASGKWAYRIVEAEAEEQPAGRTDPDAFMLDTFQLHDPTDRLVAADWLGYRGRDKEADLLRSPAGQAAIYENGKIMAIHELPLDQQRARIGLELANAGISMSVARIEETATRNAPAGVVSLSVPGPGQDRSHVADYHAAELLAAGRRVGYEGGKNLADYHGVTRPFADALERYRNESNLGFGGQAGYGILRTASYAHRLGNPTHEGTARIVTGRPELAGLSPHDRDANDGWPTKFDFYSLPAHEGGKSYYYIMSRDETTSGTGKPEEKFTQTHHIPWSASLEDARLFANNERPWDRRW